MASSELADIMDQIFSSNTEDETLTTQNDFQTSFQKWRPSSSSADSQLVSATFQKIVIDGEVNHSSKLVMSDNLDQVQTSQGSSSRKQKKKRTLFEMEKNREYCRKWRKKQKSQCIDIHAKWNAMIAENNALRDKCTELSKFVDQQQVEIEAYKTKVRQMDRTHRTFFSHML